MCICHNNHPGIQVRIGPQSPSLSYKATKRGFPLGETAKIEAPCHNREAWHDKDIPPCSNIVSAEQRLKCITAFHQ